MINRISILTVLSLALVGRSFAAVPFVVNQTYNTGYNSVTDKPLASGTDDLYFNLYSYSPAPFQGTPVVTHPDNPLWVQTSGAKWISPVEDQSGKPGTGSPAGLYDYNAFLATDFLMPTQVTVTGAFAADDSATFYVDAVPVVSDAAEGYLALTPFSYTFTLGAGPSIIPIDFLVINENTGGSQSTNSTGLLVSDLRFTTGNPTPEPGTWLMLFVGLGALFTVQRVRRAGVL
jgi:hypothetical protein